jgi:hypothetical protein
LFARLVSTILPLLQKCVTRNTLRRLLCSVLQKPVVNGQRFGFILGIDQQIKKHSVVNRSPLGLLTAGIEIAQRLRSLHV